MLNLGQAACGAAWVALATLSCFTACESDEILAIKGKKIDLDPRTWNVGKKDDAEAAAGEDGDDTEIAGPATAEQDQPYRFVRAQTNVGYITRKSTYDSIVRLFGAENVVRMQFEEGDGTIASGVKLFDGTADHLEITWKPGTEIPQWIYIFGKNWKTYRGVGIGSSMDQVQRANDRPFSMVSHEAKNEWLVSSWRGGEFPEEFGVYMRATGETENPVARGTTIYSEDKAARELAPVVDGIFIDWSQ